MTENRPHTCSRRRSWIATPLAIALGAVVISGTSAYAAAQITGAQIKNGTVTSVDVANNSLTAADLKNLSVTGADIATGTLTGAKIANGSIGAADLQPGVANRLGYVRTTQGTSADLANGDTGWQWTLPVSSLFTIKVTTQQRFTAQGIVGYKPDATANVDVAICKSVNGGPIVYMGATYGTITVPGGAIFNAPVQAETTASGVTLRVGPCLRGTAAGNAAADVSSMSLIVTNE